jgi:ABC-type multidrug transport system permease subunit
MGAFVSLFVLIMIMPCVFIVILPVVILVSMVAGQSTAEKVFNSIFKLAQDFGAAVGNAIAQFLGLIHHTFYSRWPMGTVIAYIIGIVVFVAVFISS